MEFICMSKWKYFWVKYGGGSCAVFFLFGTVCDDGFSGNNDKMNASEKWLCRRPNSIYFMVSIRIDMCDAMELLSVLWKKRSVLVEELVILYVTTVFNYFRIFRSFFMVTLMGRRHHHNQRACNRQINHLLAKIFNL